MTICDKCGACSIWDSDVVKHDRWHKELERAIQSLFDWRKTLDWKKTDESQTTMSDAERIKSPILHELAAVTRDSCGTVTFKCACGYSAVQLTPNRALNVFVAHMANPKVEHYAQEEMQSQSSHSAKTNSTYTHNAFNTASSFASSQSGPNLGDVVTCMCGWRTAVYNDHTQAWNAFYEHVRSNDPSWLITSRLQVEYCKLEHSARDAREKLNRLESAIAEALEENKRGGKDDGK